MKPESSRKLGSHTLNGVVWLLLAREDPTVDQGIESEGSGSRLVQCEITPLTT